MKGWETMKKEDFVALGIDESAAEKCAAASAEELKGFIPKARFDEVNNEKKALEKTLSERDEQLETLKKSTGNVEEMKKQIADLQAENKTKDEAHAAEMAKLKLDNAVDTALTAAGAKNIKAVRALLDSSGLKLGEDGKPEGLTAQLEALKKSDGYLFKESEAPSFKGFQPGASGDGVPKSADLSKMTYSEITAYMASNGDAKII